VLAELAIHVAAVGTTGYWGSPFVFSLATAVIVAGFARGFGFALRVGIATSTAVSIAFVTRPDFDRTDFRITVQWSVIMILVAIIAGYARRISGED
jgi:hypothetical protein